jgi:signal transduction histidine kinase
MSQPRQDTTASTPRPGAGRGKHRLSADQARQELCKAGLALARARYSARRRGRLLRDSRIALLNIVRDLEASKHEEQTLRGRLSEMNEDLETEIRKRTGQVRGLLQQKEAFVDQLGHDLKTPLTPLVALLPLLKARCEGDEEVREMFEVLISNVQYIRKLVDDTLSLARLSGDSQPVAAEWVALKAEADKVARRLQGEAEDRRVEIHIDASTDLRIRAEKTLVSQLLAELVGNAIKYSTPEGGRVEIRADRGEAETVVHVEDTGIGMDAEGIRRAFDEFYKADAARHDRASVGLGLSICRQIVEKHGGRIWAHSDGVGTGTRVSFSLPVEPPIESIARIRHSGWGETHD